MKKEIKVIGLLIVFFMAALLVEAKTTNDKTVISLVGDMCFDDMVMKRMIKNGDDFLFEGYKEKITESDILFGNLETPLTTNTVPYKTKQYHFKSEPRIAKLLKNNNFTCVGIANNHIIDYGKSGLYDTVQYLKKAGVGHAGGGTNLSEAVKPYIIEKNGIKIGFIAFSKVIPFPEWAATEKNGGIAGAYKWHEKIYSAAIKDAKTKCDILVVSVHWGKELSLVTGDEEKTTAHKMVDAGADVIMGHHPHVVQGMEYYNGKPIFYSLGNFIFTTSLHEDGNKTIMARVVVNKKKKIERVYVIPGNIIESKPVPMNDVNREAFIKRYGDKFKELN